MQYNIKLRPHHVKALYSFVTKKKYDLSNEDYLRDFQNRNKNFHNDKFVLYWKHFLTNLWENPTMRFLYTADFDTACDNCDIRKECEIKNSKINVLIKNLDDKSLKEIPLKEGEVYTVQFMLDSMS